MYSTNIPLYIYVICIYIENIIPINCNAISLLGFISIDGSGESYLSRRETYKLTAILTMSTDYRCSSDKC